MTKLIIQPHGRLNDWVADAKGYFATEGLEYEINVEGSRKNTPQLATVDSPAALEDNRFGAFERYEQGHGRKGEGAGDVSCACHWTVNQAAKVEEGIMWGKAYSVCEAAIVVPGDSSVVSPVDLAPRRCAGDWRRKTKATLLAPEQYGRSLCACLMTQVNSATFRLTGPDLQLSSHTFRSGSC